ncbi:hypothetical protein SAMN05192561_1011033 [Halopenitus malekzadehii]|uniref:DUF8049 domain-containing protein n=1 Tax=Halopenitus malekzadehii TaxID=1267564 RepID=A0A1H6IB27_9EURY|nr:hypothetical protein [Halopenitus malekzadehii]SEH43448.1 hypothetical protein SAMN05192561_1011033 [Halopenitus malekzadehii]
MDLEDAREDVIVAAVAAVSTIAVAVVGRLVPVTDPGTVPTLAPIGVYLLYLFTRKGGPYTALDTVRNWGLLAVASAFAAIGYGILG